MPQKPSKEAGESISQSTSAIKGAASAAKTTGTAINTAKVAIQAATIATESSNPAGWVMLAMKLKPIANKIKGIIRKAQLAVGALIAWLILQFGLKIAGLIAGVTFGAITGIPFLFLGPPGWIAYAGWTTFWGYYGWTHPLQMLNITQHPLIAALNAYNSIKGFLSGIGNAVTSSTATAISTSTGALAGAGIGFAVGGPPGAVIGGLIGATVGYAVGQFVIPAFSNAAIFAKGFFSGALGAGGAGIGGFLGAAGSFFTGMASTMWGGLVSAGGGVFGGLSSIGSAIWGGLSSLSVPSSVGYVAIGAPVGIATIATVGLITTSTIHFNPEGAIGQIVAGDNQYYTITKTAVPIQLGNEDLESLPLPVITFTITLEAKDTKLINISVTDTLTVSGENAHLNITTDREGNSISSNPCGGPENGELNAQSTWTCEFEIQTGAGWTDSLVTNVVNVQATPQGQAQPTIDSATATVLIGEPVQICGIIELQGNWLPEEQISINGVCEELGRSQLASSLLQNAGAIFLVKAPSGSLGDRVCGTVNGSNTVSIACDMSEANFAKYVLIHEFGHVIGNFNGEVYNAFLNSGAYRQEGLVPTYPFSPAETTWGPENESFAEMIADYVISKRYNFLARDWSNPGWDPYPGGPWENPGAGFTTFKNDFPRHYNFAKNNIFGGVEY